MQSLLAETGRPSTCTATEVIRRLCPSPTYTQCNGCVGGVDDAGGTEDAEEANGAGPGRRHTRTLLSVPPVTRLPSGATARANVRLAFSSFILTAFHCVGSGCKRHIRKYPRLEPHTRNSLRKTTMEDTWGTCSLNVDTSRHVDDGDDDVDDDGDVDVDEQSCHTHSMSPALADTRSPLGRTASARTGFVCFFSTAEQDHCCGIGPDTEANAAADAGKRRRHTRNIVSKLPEITRPSGNAVNDVTPPVWPTRVATHSHSDLIWSGLRCCQTMTLPSFAPDTKQPSSSSKSAVTLPSCPVNMATQVNGVNG